MSNRDADGAQDDSAVDHYPENCPVCGHGVLDEHRKESDDHPAFRVCDAEPGDRHQWREDGAIWSDRRKEWVSADDHDVWDTQDPDAPYSEVFGVAE